MNTVKPHNSLVTTTRLDDLFAGRRPDRVPLGSMSVSFGAVCAGYTVAETLLDADKCFEASLWTVNGG